MNKTIPLLLLLISCYGCSSDPTTEKYQRKRDNIIDIRDKIKEIVIDDVLINRYPRIHIIDHYLFIKDSRSVDEMIHIFDKDNFTYMTSTAMKGQGPGEIANLGHIAEDKRSRKFYVSDHGKHKIFSYDLDSVIADPAYIPVEKNENEPTVISG